LLGGTSHDLVVNVGDVHHMLHLDAEYTP